MSVICSIFGKKTVEKFIYSIIIVFIVAEFLLDSLLEFLNKRNSDAPVPDVLSDVIDAEQRSKTKDYRLVQYRFGQFQSIFSFVAILGLLLLGVFALLNTWVEQWATNSLAQTLLYFGVLAVAMELSGLPFSYYHTFKIEERFGFNKSTPKTFVFDTLKGWGLGLVLGGGLLALIFIVWQKTGSFFWILAWLLVSAVSIFMALFYSRLIVPLFNKQMPLDAGSLRSAIEAFSDKAGFQLENIYTIDGSKRSTKANAYFTGFGPQKRIVLYDTLIEQLAEEEVVAVLAHEVGHYKRKHVRAQLVLGILQTGLMFFLLSFVISNETVAAAIGVDKPSFHIGVLVFGLLYTPVSMLLGVLTNLYSRKCEFEADAFVKPFGLAPSLISALKKLTVKNLSNPTPHPWYVFFNYSHPDLAKRIEHLMR